MTKKATVARAVASACAGTAAPRIRTHDALQTFDQQTIDSAGAFLKGELERLDQELHTPLYTSTWGRDIDLREDVSMGDEATSFMMSSFAAPGGPVDGGKNWVGKNSNEINGSGGVPV